MKLLLPLLGLLLMTGALAQQDVDVEGLREILHSLLNSGQPVTAESLTSVLPSFSGVEKDLLTRYSKQLEGAKEAEELYLDDEITDLEVFRNLLFNMKALGVVVQPKVAEALLDVIDDPSEAVLKATVDQWKKANAVSLTDAFKNSINGAIDAIKQVVSGTSGTVRERLRAKIAALPSGMAKSVLAGLEQDLQRLAQQQEGSFSFSMEPETVVPLSAVVVKEGLSQVNKVLNREIVLFLSASMLKMNKVQAKQQVELLLRKVYDDRELPAVLEAVLANLK